MLDTTSSDWVCQALGCGDEAVNLPENMVGEIFRYTTSEMKIKVEFRKTKAKSPTKCLHLAFSEISLVAWLVSYLVGNPDDVAYLKTWLII